MRKVYDFNRDRTSANILGRPRELAWPCQMFRVTMPIAKKNAGTEEFNAFERCALKLLALGHFEPKALAEEMCLPPDFAQAILLRLFDREAIDKHYNVSESAKKLLDDTPAETSDEGTGENAPECKTFVVFRDRISGKLLPIILDAAELKSEEINDQDEVKDKRSGKFIRLHSLHLPVPETFNNPPGGDEVIAAGWAMLRRARLAGESFRMPLADKITVSPDGESCQLRVTMLLQQSSEWRIRNPFGSGWSPELEQAYMDLLGGDKDEANAFREWEKRNTAPVRSRGNDQDGATKPEPWDTPENRRAYPQLLDALARGGGDVYAILEWTLFYALQTTDTSAITALLRVDSPENNKERIAEAVCQLTGYAEPAKSIFPPVPGKLQSFLVEGMAEMQVVLPLALLAANENDRFPLRGFLKTHPDALTAILKLKERRDANRHAKTSWRRLYGEDDAAFMRSFVSGLLPRMRFPDSPPPVPADTESEADERLAARSALHDFFGVFAFDRMDDALRERLLRAEMFRQNPGGTAPAGKESRGGGRTVDAVACLNELSAAAQCAFRPVLAGSSTPPDADFASRAEARAKDAGWERLPNTLKTVRPEMVRQTLLGDDKTLGACAVAWLLVAPPETLRWAASRRPSLLSDLDTLLSKNRHGNQTCPMPEKELETLCKSIYNLVKTITEA